MATNIEPAQLTPTPALSPAPAPAPVDVSRLVWLALALADAHDSRQVSTQQLALTELLAAIRALPPGAVPVLPTVTPLDEVRRDLRDNANVFYRLRADGGCLVLALNDDEDLTVVTFERAQARQLVADLRAVLARVEVDHG